MKHKKICYVSTLPVPIYIFHRSLIKFIQMKDWKVSAVYSKKQDGFGQIDYDLKLRQLGVDVHQIEIKRKPSLIYDILALFRLWLFFLRHRFDVIHIVNSKAALLTSIAAFFAFQPNRLSSILGRNYENMTGFKRSFFVFLDKITHIFSTYLLVDSPSIKSEILKDGIGTDNSILLINNGSCCGFDASYYSNDQIQPKQIESIRTAWGVLPHNKILLNVGRLREDKGINELVRTFCNLQTSYTEWRLVLLGHRENSSPLAKDTIYEIEHNPNICCCDWVEDPRAIFAAADIFVFPTWREGFGNVSVEAALMGLPVVVADSVGARDTIENNVTGLLFKKGDMRDLYTKLEILMNSTDEFRLKMGQAGRERAIKIYDQNEYSNWYFDLYSSLQK